MSGVTRRQTMAVTTEEVADAMYELVAEYQGRKKFKPGDLIKAMI